MTARRENATTTVPGVSPVIGFLPSPVERRLALEEAHLDLRERVADERQRLDRAEQEDVAVLTAEHEARPRRPALLVLRPLDFVQDERLPAQRSHLGGAAEDRRVLVDPLLARHEPDLPLPQLRAQPAVRLLREHPQRRRVYAASRLDEEAERVVRLAGVRRAEVRDHRLWLDGSLGEANRQLGDGLPRRCAPPMPLAPAGTLLASLRH